MMNNVELRDNAEIIESSKTCVICNHNLSVATGHREDRGVCTYCGFPYKVNPEKGEIEDYVSSVVYSSYDVSAREIECISKFSESEGKPAPLWSYSPFKYDLFEEFSKWASRNGFEEFAWV